MTALRPKPRWRGFSAGRSPSSARPSLVGSLAGIDWLGTVVPGLASMKFNSTPAFVAAGLSLYLAPMPAAGVRGRVAAGLAAAAGLIGLLTLVQDATGSDLGIDQLVMRDRTAKPEDVPGRMSAISASCFVVFGAARLAADGADRWSRAAFLTLSMSGLLASSLVLLGYAYSVPVLYRPLPATPIAVHAAIAFVMLFIGLLLSRPDRGWVRLLRSRGPGGVLAQRVLPAVLLLSPVIGWIRLQGEQVGYFGTEFGVALFAIVNVMVLTGLLWWAALRIDRLDAARREFLMSLEQTSIRLRESEQRYRNVSDLIEVGIWIEVDGAIVYSNPHMDRIIGADVAGNVLGMPILSFFRGDDLRARRGAAADGDTGDAAAAAARGTPVSARRPRHRCRDSADPVRAGRKAAAHEHRPRHYDGARGRDAAAAGAEDGGGRAAHRRHGA